MWRPIKISGFARRRKLRIAHLGGTTKMLRLFMLLWLCCFRVSTAMAAPAAAAPQTTAEQWGIFELALNGSAAGNPFIDVNLSAKFTDGSQSIEVSGFYDGGGIYRVRFMPTELGDWHFETRSNLPELNGKTGQFTAIKAAAGNHGPVKVRATYHFGYADGTPYFPFGTTSYAWTSQGDILEEQTLATLKAAPFNKIRMCVFPKRYTYNANEPVYYPFELQGEGKPPDNKNWDFTHFNPVFFQHLEKRIGQLRDLGIEADLILFHPYDRNAWGFDRMPKDVDDRYLRYVIARLGAYRNIWWSLANEFDFMTTKTDADWARFLQIVHASDPYGHLTSIHNGSHIYNDTLPTVTHASIQNGSAAEDVGRASLYREAYGKPIMLDEVKYEGNIVDRFGSLSAEEMTHRFWVGTVSGVYVTHGETYMDPHDVLWWGKGGVLHGQSPQRIAFLRKIVEAGSADGIDPIDIWEDARVAGKPGEYYLLYFGKDKPGEWTFELPKPGLQTGMAMHVDVLDAWNMTITPVPDTFTMIPSGRYRFRAENDAKVKLPGLPYIALRITRVK